VVLRLKIKKFIHLWSLGELRLSNDAIIELKIGGFRLKVWQWILVIYVEIITPCGLNIDKEDEYLTEIIITPDYAHKWKSVYGCAYMYFKLEVCTKYAFEDILEDKRNMSEGIKIKS